MIKNDDELVEFVDRAKFPTFWGDFYLYAFSDSKGKTHLAIVRGEVENKEDVCTRVHSRCLTGDALGSLRCDCREQYEKAMEYISKQDNGVLIYMNQEGRGIGLANKVRAYALQDKGLDTVEANHQLGFADDIRAYDVAAHIIKFLKIKSIILLSNNPRKIRELADNGILISDRKPIIAAENEYDKKYLKTKKEKMGHLFDEDEQDG
jgi:GTP cyclohydrolase II